MLFQLTFLITILGLATAAPLQRRFGDSYKVYSGDGSCASGWPARNTWGSYEELWNANVPLMKQSCGWNGWGADNSDQEISDINTAIKSVAKSEHVDARIILALMMQESKGCVRVPTTNNGVVNPGLFQSHNGAGTCAGVSPCPLSQIEQMIKDGIAGTSSGSGYKTIHESNKKIVGNNMRSVYGAFRIYNSGSADWSNLNNGLGSTGCYVSDVANRLMGWTMAASACTS